jgi:hypothetical protein
MEINGGFWQVAPWAGVEPATFRLTVERSTAELPGNAAIVDSGGAITKHYCRCKESLWLFFARLATEPVEAREWRPRPELNRGTRICSPLRHHSATWPQESECRDRRSGTAAGGYSRPALLRTTAALRITYFRQIRALVSRFRNSRYFHIKLLANFGTEGH